MFTEIITNSEITLLNLFSIQMVLYIVELIK